MAEVTSIAQRIITNVEQVIVGKRPQLILSLVSWLCEGHILLEDVPGVAKTILARALAKSVGCRFKRVQCTPDLLPTDVTGASIFNPKTTEFEFRPGPIFGQLVLADEINRATPRTQAALLEAMAEAKVTVDGHSHPLTPPFLVIATQNPVDHEGTFPLPEAQLDRFLMRIGLGYPSPDDEARILDVQPARNTLRSLEPVLSVDDVRALQQTTDEVRMDRSLADYVIALAQATRESDDLLVGMSPRGSLALAQAARASAVLAGRDHCVPEDIVENVLPVCAHRVVTRNTMHDGDTVTSRRIMQRILETVASPV